jgi:flagellar motility protein MotE (MotC chaperone)
MPKSSVDKAISQNPKQQESVKNSKGASSYILTLLLIIIIIATVSGGVFYFIIRNNIGGLAERYRASIQDNPLAKLALTKAPDPLDPKYMSENEVKEKYLEFREENEALNKRLSDANTRLDEYQGYRDDFENLKLDTDKKLQEIKDREAAMDKKELQLKELQKKIDELIANGDKESFKTYYETIDPENAKLLYTEIVKEQQVDANTKRFAQLFAEMDAAAAAQIFEQLGNSQMDLIAQTLKGMNKADSAPILESMTPAFAAKVTVKLDALYKEN